jgi:hypothetical protein
MCLAGYISLGPEQSIVELGLLSRPNMNKTKRRLTYQVSTNAKHKYDNQYACIFCSSIFFGNKVCTLEQSFQNSLAFLLHWQFKFQPKTSLLFTFFQTFPRKSSWVNNHLSAKYPCLQICQIPYHVGSSTIVTPCHEITCNLIPT